VERVSARATGASAASIKSEQNTKACFGGDMWASEGGDHNPARTSLPVVRKRARIVLAFAHIVSAHTDALHGAAVVRRRAVRTSARTNNR
jgi:hypothetical protein